MHRLPRRLGLGLFPWESQRARSSRCSRGPRSVPDVETLHLPPSARNRRRVGVQTRATPARVSVENFSHSRARSRSTCARMAATLASMLARISSVRVCTRAGGVGLFLLGLPLFAPFLFKAALFHFANRVEALEVAAVLAKAFRCAVSEHEHQQPVVIGAARADQLAIGIDRHLNPVQARGPWRHPPAAGPRGRAPFARLREIPPPPFAGAGNRRPAGSYRPLCRQRRPSRCPQALR